MRQAFPKGLREARPHDIPQIRRLLYLSPTAYYYPGWDTLEQWHDHVHILTLARSTRVDAALACTLDGPGVAWFRLFVVHSGLNPRRVWDTLWPPMTAWLQGQGVQRVVGLGLSTWLETLMKETGWHVLARLKYLVWRGPQAVLRSLSPCPVTIRPAREEDRDALLEVNVRAFAPEWQLGTRVAAKVLKHALLTFVAEDRGRVVGYILATPSMHGVHIANFGVLPEVRRQGIGEHLLRTMLQTLVNAGYTWITLNTQEDNEAALRLYTKLGFQETGQCLRVWHKPIFVSTAEAPKPSPRHIPTPV